MCIRQPITLIIVPCVISPTSPLRYYAQLCVDKLTSLLKHAHYRTVCSLYLWKVQVRLSGVVPPIPGTWGSVEWCLPYQVQSLGMIPGVWG